MPSTLLQDARYEVQRNVFAHGASGNLPVGGGWHGDLHAGMHRELY